MKSGSLVFVERRPRGASMFSHLKLHSMKATLIIGICSMLSIQAVAAGTLDVVVSPASSAVQRVGITGAGWAVVAEEGRRITLHYSNHPDDFGGSTGTGTATSSDGGVSWTAGPDDWPVPKTMDVWQNRLRDGSFLALGIRWLPDPAKRGQTESVEVPRDAWAIASSKDGRDWQMANAEIECPPEIGVIARPLPTIIEDEHGVLLMPAYAWGKRGTSSVLLKSEDRGRHWKVLSTITTADALAKAGAQLATPWFETSVARASDGSLLAVMRTGSSPLPKSALVSARSTDGGLTWGATERLIAGPEREPVAGKLPGLVLMGNGVLALVTANSKSGCFLYLSPDGTGREWSAGHVITKVSGGNASMVALDADHLLVFTPAARVINCWRVAVKAK